MSLPLILDYLENPLKFLPGDATWTVDPSSGYLAAQRIPRMDEVLPVEELGQGAFSVAYLLQDGTVVKVPKREDEHYDAYVQYAMDHQDNPWVPQIFARIPQGRRFVYHMEYLPKRPDYTIVDDVIRAVNERTTKRVCPNLLRLIEEFGQLNLNDVKPDNMAMRGDQPVLTDPCGRFMGLGERRPPPKEREQHLGFREHPYQPFVFNAARFDEVFGRDMRDALRKAEDARVRNFAIHPHFSIGVEPQLNPHERALENKKKRFEHHAHLRDGNIPRRPR
jgi:hypothetical protein